VERRRLDGIGLAYEVSGSGDPVLLIPASLLADGFSPLVSEPSLADHHRLIRYHRRGMGGSTRTDGPVTVADQAKEAAGLLAQLGVERAHIVGHSYGGLIGLQLALDNPQLVGSLALLEPNLLAVPGSAAFNDEVRPAFAAYRAGEKEKAVAHFLSVVAGLPWSSCRQLIEEAVPGGVTQAMADAETFFAVEVPALRHWAFGAEDAATLTSPVLSALGSASHWFFREGRQLLRQWFPHLEELDVEDAGHLLQLQNHKDLASGLASFFARHPL
jgi:pimeloyl-ACP methyl ester carboxylesterase